jgi:hypothetical protein
MLVSGIRKSETVLYGLVAGACAVVVTVPAALLLGSLATYLLGDRTVGSGEEWASLVLSVAIYLGIIAGVVVCGMEIRSRLSGKSTQ